MRWTVKDYCAHVYLKHRLKLVKWPEDVPFANLSKITGKARISRLHALWTDGVMRFEPVSNPEFDAAMLDPLCAAPSALHDGIPPRSTRCDVKKRRYRPRSNPLDLPGRYVRNGPKSEVWVTDEAEARAEAEIAMMEVV